MSSDHRPPGEDPWEARERQRQYYRNKTASPRSTPARDGISVDPGPPPDYSVYGLLLAAALLLLAEVPSGTPTLRKLLTVGGSALILLLVAVLRQPVDTLRQALCRAPNLLILALVGWSGVELFLAPYRSFAAVEMLRVVAGAGAYTVAAYGLRSQRQIAYVAAGIIGMAVAISLYDIAHAAQGGTGLREHIDYGYSVFGTHENIASLLVLLLPIALGFALSGTVEEKRRLAATAATIVLGVALLVARTRSAWLGGLVALAALSLLTLRFPTSDKLAMSGHRRGGRLTALISSPALLLTLGLLAFVVIGGVGPVLLHRAGTFANLGGDISLGGRVEMWAGAARMATERAVLGWGLGSYPVLQGLWTHSGADIPAALTTRIGHENIAHDYYLQWAAETGGIGLALYVAAIASFLFVGLRALPRVRTPFERVLLCGCLATILGGSADALASPAYNFHGVSTIFWICMGLGVAAMRPPVRSGTSPAPALDATPWGVWGGSLAVGLAAVAILLAVGSRIRAEGSRVPRGTFELTAEPAGAIRPGMTVRWRAVYHDEHRKDCPTMPGTAWLLAGDSGVSRIQATLTEQADNIYVARHSVLSIVAPAKSTPSALTMRARYFDRYGRRYEAWSTLTVQAAKPR